MTTIEIKEDPDGYFVFEKVDIADLSEADARFIFGDGVYESWKELQNKPKKCVGTCTVTGIDSAAGRITVDQT